MKRRFIIAIILLILGPAARSHARQESAPAPGTGMRGAPPGKVPTPLREAWLHFHESGLCQNLDTVFVFHPDGMEIWCRAKDDKGCQDLVSLVEPLRNSYRIDVYVTHADREKKPWSPEDDEPLPSLWNNTELRSFMRDPFTPRFSTANDDTISRRAPDSSDADMKRRLKSFGDQVLDWARKMGHLADDLPALAGLAYGKDAPADTRALGQAVCLDHVREIGRNASKLVENLSHAIPRGAKAAPWGKPNPSPAARSPLTAAPYCSRSRRRPSPNKSCGFFIPSRIR